VALDDAIYGRTSRAAGVAKWARPWAQEAPMRHFAIEPEATVAASTDARPTGAGERQPAWPWNAGGAVGKVADALEMVPTS
jgi:hypothetical protein